MSTTILPGESLDIRVRFSPTAVGIRSGQLTVITNAIGSPHVIPMSGTATAIPGEPDPEPSALTYLTADGGVLRDQKGAGDIFMLRSINWYGFEQLGIPMGAWTRPFRTKVVDGVVMEGMLDEIKRLGFNSLRILVSQDCTWAGHKPETRFGPYWNTTFINPEMNGEFLNDPVPQNPQDVKTTIEIMDIFMDMCEDLGLRVILDMHCLAPDDNNVLATAGKWYTTADPGDAGATAGVRREPRNEAQAIAAFVFWADRYKNRPVLPAFDLINEPHSTTWDRDPLTGVVGYYERCGNAIHAVNPDVLVICEGVAELGMNNGAIDHTPEGHEEDEASLQGKYKWGVVWSGKLDEVARIANVPVTLTIPNKVVYSPHEYGAYPGDPAAHQWFYPEEYVGETYAGEPFPDNMFAVWYRSWGYLAELGIAPVWIGEAGSYFRDGGDPVTGAGSTYNAVHLAYDQAWFGKLGDYCNTNNIGFAFWAWNPGGDPDGLLEQFPAGTWRDAQGFKLELLEPFLPDRQTDPSASVSVSPSTLNYGEVEVDTDSSLNLTLVNPLGTAVTGLVGVTTGLSASPSSFTVPAHGTVTVTVTFTPTTLGDKTGTVTLTMGSTIKTVAVVGVGAEEPGETGPDITLPGNAVGIATIGDSITWFGFYENNGWCSQACFQYDQLHRYRGTYAVIGTTSTQALNEQLPSILAMNPPPKACAIGTGTNNVFQVVEGTNDVKAICEILIANNIYPVLWTVTPRNDTTANDADILAWNTIIRDYSEERGLALVDAFAMLKMPDSNRMNSIYDFGDGLHLNTYALGQLGKYVVDQDAFGRVPHDGVFVLPSAAGGANRVPNPTFLDSNSDGVANNLTLATGFTGSISTDSDGIRWQKITRPGGLVGTLVANTVAPFAITGGQTYSLAARIRWDTDGWRGAIEGHSWTAVASVLFTTDTWTNFPNSSFLVFGSDGGEQEQGIMLRDDLVAPAGANRVLVSLFVIQDEVPARDESCYIEFAQLAMVQGSFPLSGIDPDPTDPEEYPNALLDSDGNYITDSNNIPLES